MRLGAIHRHQLPYFRSGATPAPRNDIKRQYTSAPHKIHQHFFFLSMQGGRQGGTQVKLPDTAGHWQHPQTQGPRN